MIFFSYYEYRSNTVTFINYIRNKRILVFETAGKETGYIKSKKGFKKGKSNIPSG